MFGRKPAATPEEPISTPTAVDDPTAPKGRPTPSRRDAQAARKQNLTVPKDPKAARKAARERERDDRTKARQAVLAGDERYYPVRDQGAGRAFARDFVDSRFTAAEWFLFVALGVLLVGFIRNPTVQSWATLLFFAFSALIIVDTIVLVVQMNMRAKKVLTDPADRRGITLYAILRTLQFRRLRLPPPRVRRGGAPVVRKTK